MPVGTGLIPAFSSAALTSSGRAGVAISISAMARPSSASLTQPPTKRATIPASASAAMTAQVCGAVIQGRGAMVRALLPLTGALRSPLRLDMAGNDPAILPAWRHIDARLRFAEMHIDDHEHDNQQQRPRSNKPHPRQSPPARRAARSEEHTSELQSRQ